MPEKFYGKHRGRVRNNRDPLSLGRLQVEVPALPGIRAGWALPCLPYAGDKVGFLALPPVGAMVWVEFEGGDPAYPIWTGCFWEDGQAPVKPVTPEVKFFVTENFSLKINDQQGAGGLTIEVKSPAVKTAITITLDNTGATVECKPARLHLDPKGIEAELSPARLSVSTKSVETSLGPCKTTVTSKDIELSAPPSSFKLEQGAITGQLGMSQLSLKPDAAQLSNAASSARLSSEMLAMRCGAAEEQLMSQGNILLNAAGASVRMGQGMVNVNNGALEVI